MVSSARTKTCSPGTRRRSDLMHASPLFWVVVRASAVLLMWRGNGGNYDEGERSSVLGLIGVRAQEAVTTCSNLNSYVDWIRRFEGRCTFPSVSSDDFGWFQTCDWITCEWYETIGLQSKLCMSRGRFLIPVGKIYACFEQGLKMSFIEHRTQAFVLALLQTCRGKTQHLSQPCGECDKYKSLRTQCKSSTTGAGSNTTTSVRALEFQDTNPYGMEIPRTERGVQSAAGPKPQGSVIQAILLFLLVFIHATAGQFERK